jgi:hypothetical protein
LRVSNFLTCSNQTKLLRPQRIHVLIRLDTEDRVAIIASMPLCNEWGPIVTPTVSEVAARGVDEELTMVQRIHLVSHLLMDQEAIEENEGSNALVHLPRWCLMPLHPASPWASAPGVNSSAGASTSYAAPVGGPSPSVAGWDDLEWGCLLDPPR